MARQTKKTRWTVPTLSQASEVLCVSAKTIGEYIARGCPGRKGAYPLPAMIVWARENIWKPRPLPIPIDDPMLASGDSPALERYRMARAGQEEIKLQTMQGDFLPLTEIHAAFAVWADSMRRMQQQLQTECGARAGEIHEEAVLEMDAAFTLRFGEPDQTETEKVNHDTA